MAEEIPRRMMRFYRKKPTEGEVRSKSSEIAVKEVDSFREEHNRYPNQKELEEISQKVFDQLKREIEKGDSNDSEAEDIYLGSQETKAGERPGKSLADIRRKKRAGIRKAEDARERQEKSREAQGRKGDSAGKGRASGGAGGKVDSGAAMGNVDDETKEGPEGRDESEGSELPDSLRDGGNDESIKELEELEAKKAGVRKLADIDDLSKLESGLEGDEEEGEDELDLFVEKEIETGGSMCPHCNNKAEEIIYCPECGDAFCSHCAKKMEVLPGAIKYMCPKCGAQFKKMGRK
ncbi:Uncharacterised protein [uncultured archaeon]|nr:Uncharacterised protein [uncultured archaeon]